MIHIQIILILCFTVLLVRFLGSPNSAQTKAWKKILGVVFTCMAIAAVITPELLNIVAHKLGVGRGADLLLYVLTLAFLASKLGDYTNKKREQQLIVKLARKVAILEANEKG